MEDNFEHPVLTKVHGSLTYPALKTIKDELKANAASIHSELGGGTNGHLGLVLSAAEYALVSAVPYVRYVHPVSPIILPGTTNHEATRLRKDYRDQKKMFKEMIKLEK